MQIQQWQSQQQQRQHWRLTTRGSCNTNACTTLQQRLQQHFRLLGGAASGKAIVIGMAVNSVTIVDSAASATPVAAPPVAAAPNYGNTIMHK